VFKLDLVIEQYAVRISISTEKITQEDLKVTRKDFEQFVRKPRLFDYIEAVHIDQNQGEYYTVESGTKTTYKNITDNLLISELVTYRNDLQNRAKTWMQENGVPYKELVTFIKPSIEIPAPTCIWTTPRVRVILGVDPHLEPPEIIGHMHGCAVVDRTGMVNFSTSKQVTDHPMPDFNIKEERSIDEIILERAEILWQWIEKGDKLGMLWWSGGIDSTAMIVAMIQTSTPIRMQLIKVGLNQRSIEEYPLFFNKYIKQLPQMFISHNDGLQIDLDVLHISGEIGDQIFGSDYLRACFGGGGRIFAGQEHFLGNIKAPWEDVMSLFVRDQLLAKNLPAEYHATLMDTYNMLNVNAPLEIVTLFDFWWWSNFNLKYTHVANRLQLNSSNSALAHKRIDSFFDSDTFQRWSVNNHDKKIGDTWKSYKAPLKDFVYSFTKDRDWQKNKTKVQSLRMGVSANTLLMDSNYNRFSVVDKEKLIKAYFGGKDGRG